jgi:hypothetical protein
MVLLEHVPMELNFLPKNELAVKANSHVGYFFNRKEKEIKWETRGKKIKENAKTRKKASNHQRRNGSKKR